MNAPATPDASLADHAVKVELSPPRLLAKGYCAYERYVATIEHPGAPARAVTRDILRSGRVAALLPLDLVRNEIVLIRQFRLAAHLAHGLGEMVEIVAGRVEANEDIVETARRECLEEIGVAPRALKEAFTFLPTPGISDEAITLFVGTVDAARVAERGGAADEHEETRPLRVAIDTALAALAEPRMHNGILLIALQWLALNRHRLGVFMGDAAGR